MLAVSLSVLAWCAGRLAVVDSSLGYDEAVYAIGGQSLVTGAGGADYPVYRPIGMRLLAAPGALLGGDETAFRLFSVGYSLLCLALFWRLGRQVAGAAAATLAMATLATSGELQRRAAELLSDLPALAPVFVLLALLVRELERDGGPARRLLAVAPLAALAFYLRYGSTLILLAVAAAAAAVWWPVLVRRWRMVAATGGLFALCMLPHLVHAAVATGSPLGIVRAAHDAAGRRYVGEGLAYLWQYFPDKPAGPFVALLALIGLCSGLAHLLRLRRERVAEHRVVAFLWLAAVLHTLAIGLDVHGQARFVFFGTFLLALLGARAVVVAVRGATGRAVLDLALPAALMALFLAERAHDDAREHADRSRRIDAVMRAAADVVRAQGHGSCAVLTTMEPRVAWYSGCEGWPMPKRNAAAAIARLRASSTAQRFVVLFAKARREPTGALRAELLEGLVLPPVAQLADAAGVLGDAEVYRVR